MWRVVDCAALLGSGLALALLLAGTAWPRVPEHDWQQGARGAVAGTALRLRTDVDIRISGRSVALGFDRPDCDGLLLLAPLPSTAQGWAHVAPRLDLAKFAVGYAYAGEMTERVPGLRRLADRLLHELRGTAGAAPRVVAFAEKGNCRLAVTALAALGELRSEP